MRPVSDNDLAVLRGLVSGDLDSTEAALRRITSVDEVGPLSVLVAIALQMSAREYFRRPYTTGDIIAYVAELRASDPDVELDGRTAEKVLLAMLSDDDRASGLSAEKRSVAQAALLRKLGADLELDAAELDNFMANARRITDDWIVAYGDQIVAGQ